ncbi:hypothetical protein COBT_002896, partial [Conglomerata obtusa]
MYFTFFILSFVGFLHADLTHIDGQNTDVKIITNFLGAKNSYCVNLILLFYYDFDFEIQVKTIDPKILNEAYIDVCNKMIFETFIKHFKSKLNIKLFSYEVSEIDAYDIYSTILQEKKERVRNNLPIGNNGILFRMIELSVMLKRISKSLGLRARSNCTGFCGSFYLSNFFDMLAILYMADNKAEQESFFIRLVQLYLAAKCVQLNNYPNANQFILYIDLFYLHGGKYLEKVRCDSKKNLFVILWDEKLFELDIYEFCKINIAIGKNELWKNSKQRRNLVNEFIDVDTYNNAESCIFKTDKLIINKIGLLIKFINDQKGICFASKNDQDLHVDEIHNEILKQSDELI